MSRVYRKHIRPNTVLVCDQLAMFDAVRPLMMEVRGCDVIRDPSLESGEIRATIIHSKQEYIVNVGTFQARLLAATNVIPSGVIDACALSNVSLRKNRVNASRYSICLISTVASWKRSGETSWDSFALLS